MKEGLCKYCKALTENKPRDGIKRMTKEEVEMKNAGQALFFVCLFVFMVYIMGCGDTVAQSYNIDPSGVLEQIDTKVVSFEYLIGGKKHINPPETAIYLLKYNGKEYLVTGAGHIIRHTP